MVAKVVEIFTDGACRGNPGPGGWGVLMRYNGHTKSLSGSEENTTNNRMELMAAIQGLAHLKRSCDIVLTTDSVYVQKGITEWLIKWKRTGWRTASKKPVKNQDLWEKLDAEIQRHPKIDWRWVKGHSGHEENEMADSLANQAIDIMLGRL